MIEDTSIDWTDPALLAVLAERDIPRLFRLLRDRGISQRRISEHVRMGQSEVSEIINGRQVQSYDVLLRIATCLDLPRGAMGLAYDGDLPSPYGGVEVDDDVERRKFLGAASTALFGSAVLGEVGSLAVTGTGREQVKQVGMADVQRLQRLNDRLRIMERQLGGDAMRGVLATHALDADRLSKATTSDAVRVKLGHAISHAHQLAGWAAGDLGMMDHCRWHFGKALDYTKGDGERTAEVLAAAGSMEKHDGNSRQALKLFQLGAAATGTSNDPQIAAVLHASSASAYQKLGHDDRARVMVREARSRFKDATPSRSLPFFEYYGSGNGVLAAAEIKLRDYDRAHGNVTRALATRPSYDTRCQALDTIVLSRIQIESGELAKGVKSTRQVIDLVADLDSLRVLDRLEPLQKTLAARHDSTCQDLARRIATMRV